MYAKIKGPKQHPSYPCAAALALAAISFTPAGGAFAQGSAPRLEEIVVSAQRRDERLQDVPVAVTAFSARDVLDAGIESTADFIALTPNVGFDDSFTVGNSFVTLRGVTQINNADSPVAIVIDGVPQNNQKQFKMELYDIERIEILKGPQGALYGRNAIGGAVNIVTRQPTNEPEGWVQAGIGNGSRRKISAAASGPIIDDTLLFRVVAGYTEFDGLIVNRFLDDKVDFYDSTDVQGRLTWLASDALRIDLRGAISRADGGATYDAAFFDSTSDDNTNLRRDPVTDILGRSSRDMDDVALVMDYEAGMGTLTAITAYTRVQEDYLGDLDFCNPVDCPGGFFGFGQVDQMQDLDVELLSQELRLVSPDDQRLRWIAGVYGLRTDRDLLTRATLTELGNFEIVRNEESNRNYAYSVFGQVDFDITERTEISASLRFDEDIRRQTDVATGESRKATFSALQPRLVLSHQFTDEGLGYVSYAHGFRSGGFNGIGGREFAQEELHNLEIGYKTTFADNRVVLNSALFASRSDDFQFFFVDIDAGGAQVIDNLARVRLWGAEVELRALITEQWQVYGALGLLDSDIRRIDDGLTVPAEEGNRTPKTQRHSVNLGTQLGVPLTPGIEGVLRVDYERRGRKYWHTDNVSVLDPVDLLNARLALRAERWEVALWGRNLTDTFYYADFNAQPFTGLPHDIAHRATPRTWGVDFRYEF